MAGNTAAFSVFDLLAPCSVSCAKDAGSSGDVQTRGGHRSATHYSFAFSSACSTCLVKQISAYICCAGATAEEVLQRLLAFGEAEEVLWRLFVLGQDYVKAGRRVVQVPGKAVLTRKFRVGKRRFRCLACVPQAYGDAAILYAFGIEGVTLRAAVAYAATRSSSGLTADIKRAFLNALLEGIRRGCNCVHPD